MKAHSASELPQDGPAERLQQQHPAKSFTASIYSGNA